MKFIQQSVIMLLATALPLALAAQSSSGSSAGSSSPDTSRSGSSTSDMTPGSTTLQPITKDALNGQFTAKDLLDKEVYDRDQKKIGKVVDIVLGNEAGGLSGLSQNSSQSDMTRSDMSRTSTSGSSSSGMSGSSSTGTRNSTASTPGMSTGSSNYSGKSNLDQTSAPVAVVISHGGLLTGKDLFRAPLSRLSYDANNKRLTLDASASEIDTLTGKTSSSSR